MSNLTSHRVNKTPKKKPEEGSSLSTSAKNELTLNQILVVLVNQSTLVKTTQTSACSVLLHTRWTTALISAECLLVKGEISSFVNICVLAVRPVGVTRWRAIRRDGNAKLAQGCILPAFTMAGFDHTMIVPVWVRPVGEPEKEIVQYAVLDDHSNVSFVSEALCEPTRPSNRVIVDNNATAECTR